MKLEKRKKYYNLCNPYSTLDTDSKEILDIDNIKINNKIVDVRGGDRTRDIIKKIVWNDNSSNVFFTGYAGSGKTTELRRVIKELSNDENNYLSIYVDSSEYFDMHSDIDLSDVLTVIMHNVIVGVAKHQNINEEDAFKDSIFTRTWKWLKDTNVTLDKFEVGIDASKLTFNMKETKSLRDRVKQSINDNLSKYKQDIKNELEKLNNKVIKSGKKGIVLVLDQLEKNIGIGHNVDSVKDSMLRLFSDKKNLELPINVIYTVPSFLSAKGQLSDLFFLPVIKVIQKDGQPYDEGISVVKELIYKRVPRNDIKEILGEDYESKLKKIIQFSGGYPRDLLVMMQKIIQNDTYPVSNDDINSIFQKKINDYQEFLTEEYENELKNIHISKQISDKQDINYDLFNVRAIFRYNNEDLWFCIHPAIKKILNLY